MSSNPQYLMNFIMSSYRIITHTSAITKKKKKKKKKKLVEEIFLKQQGCCVTQNSFVRIIGISI